MWSLLDNAVNTYSPKNNKWSAYKYVSKDLPDSRSTMNPTQSVEKPYATERNEQEENERIRRYPQSVPGSNLIGWAGKGPWMNEFMNYTFTMRQFFNLEHLEKGRGIFIASSVWCTLRIIFQAACVSKCKNVISVLAILPSWSKALVTIIGFASSGSI
jgi:hypothetical protein